MWEIYDDLIASVPEDLTVVDYMIGMHWVLVRSEKGTGVAKALKGGRKEPDLDNISGMPLKQLAGYVKSWDWLQASLGLAAINAALNQPGHVEDISEPDDPNAFAHFTADFAQKKVALVGHFPRLEVLKSVCRLSILDREPRDDDYPDSASEYILPDQDFVYITGTTFINKTLPRLLQLPKKARVVLVGPSVPLAPALFKYGVDALAGVVINDQEAFWSAVRQGGKMSVFDQGGQTVFLQR